MIDRATGVLLMQLPYFLCSLAAFGTALFCAVIVRKRLRPRWWVLGVGAYAALGLGFFLLAATSTNGGYLPRSAVALPIRWAFLLAGVLWCALLLLIARSSVRVTRTPVRGAPDESEPPGCVGRLLLWATTGFLWGRHDDNST